MHGNGEEEWGMASDTVTVAESNCCVGSFMCVVPTHRNGTFGFTENIQEKDSEPQ